MEKSEKNKRKLRGKLNKKQKSKTNAKRRKITAKKWSA
jgi:hypothetical protein